MSASIAWRSGLAAVGLAAIATAAALPWLAPLERVMLPLILLVGGVTLRFSVRYLDGRPDAPRFVGWFLATLVAASTVVLAENLLVMGLAWTATSLSLHQLLLYGELRPAAQVAAHKKFLLSRVADVALAVAITLLVTTFGSTARREILDAVAAAETLPAAVHVAGALLALATILRSAQLPVHGWLLQVMEAPTPVSALLHAGIVNLGAFVMISLGPLVLRLPVAQTLLVVVGAMTAGLALLAQRTQGNIKGALAWSTVAQMGFVLVECGLGLFDLALLHVVAHALYKAHAFLSSGGVVERSLRAGPSVAAATTRAAAPRRLPVAAVLSLAWVGAVSWLALGPALLEPARIAATVILLLALTPTFAQALAGERAALGVAIAVPLLYAAWHGIFGLLVPEVGASALAPALSLFVSLVFVAMATVQAQLAATPGGRLAQALYPHAHAGFHIDALFTRLTFRVWPPTVLPRPVVARRATVLRAQERAA